MSNHLPFIAVESEEKACWSGWKPIGKEILRAASASKKQKFIVVVECFHGTYEGVNFKALKKELSPDASCKSTHIFKDPEEIKHLVHGELNLEDKSYQVTNLTIHDYFDSLKKTALLDNISSIEEGLILIFGIGASEIWKADLLIYADMSQWEIQQRFKRKDIDNIGLQNYDTPFDDQYYWSFFNDWPICNKIKKDIIEQADYFLETNNWKKPKLATGKLVRKGLIQATFQPFKLAPFFDPELWDGKKKAAGKDANFLWVYNCNPEEDNMLFKFEKELFEIPLLNLIFFQATSFLGKRMVQHFGTYLPIHFNFVDTFEENKSTFKLNPFFAPITNAQGDNYYQSCFYYFIHTGKHSTLEVVDLMNQPLPSTLTNKKSGISRKVFSPTGKRNLKDHDGIHLPNGAAFRVNGQSIALQITSTPEIFSFQFKDQIPKIAFSILQNQIKFKPDLIPNEIQPKLQNQEVSQTEELIYQDAQNSIKIVRHWFEGALQLSSREVVNIINLVEGEEAIVESPSANFPTLILKHGETLVIPANVATFQIRSLDDMPRPMAIVRARVYEG